jgi:CheY-like chemotaxis protein
MPTMPSSMPPARSPAASAGTTARRAEAPPQTVTEKPRDVDVPHREDAAMAKILIVEDDEMNRDMLSRRLMRRGYDVTIAVDGVEGVRLATERHPDLILMDMSLPEMDGWQAIRELKAADVTATIPVIALTAHAMADDRRRAIEAGCNDFDTKPVELTRLLGKIEALLARK